MNVLQIALASIMLAAFTSTVPATAADVPTAADVGIPQNHYKAVTGTIVLTPGKSTVISMRDQGNVSEDGERIQGRFLRNEPTSFVSFAPVDISNQSDNTARLTARAAGKGYVVARRFCIYDVNGVEQRSPFLAYWIVVVNDTGTIQTETTAPPLNTTFPDSVVRDIAHASIRGRVVLQGSSTGVADAIVSLHSEKTGVIRQTWTTDANGRFHIVADGLLASGRYELTVRKPSTEIKRADSFMGDLWPVKQYFLTVSPQTAADIDVGVIELTPAGDIWGGQTPVGRPPHDTTPPITSRPPSGGTTAPAGPATPGTTPAVPPTNPQRPPLVNPPPAQPPSTTPPVPPSDTPPGLGRTPVSPSNESSPDNNIPPVAPPAKPTRTQTASYKGYVEVDFNLKATMVLTFKDNQVTGRLEADPVMQPNVRLPGAHMKLTGTLSGIWEESGVISGNCSGHIRWPGGGDEERNGTFTIRKRGTDIYFSGSGFYYNRYVFGAQGIRYEGGADNSQSGKRNGPMANSVVILLDASGSMKGNKISSAKATAKRQVARLGADTELAVISFAGRQQTTVAPFTVMDSQGKSQVQAAIDGVNTSGGTPLAAGIRAAGVYMRAHASGKKLSLVVLSDGKETEGGDPVEEVRRLNQQGIRSQ